MKKILLPLILVAFWGNICKAIGPGPVDTIVTILNAAQAAGSMPAIIDNAGNNRGAAFNGKHVYVASRQNGNHVYYWDVKDPKAAPKELSIAGITGGTFVLSDLAVSGSNVFVSNMVLAGGTFKVYHWSGVESQPRVLLEYPTAPDRLGDAITVIGDPAQKALLIASGHGSKRFYVWNIENGAIANTTPTVQTYDFTTNVSFGRMTRVPGTEPLYLASAPSFGMMLLDSTLKMVDTIGAAFFPSWAMHAQVFEYKGIRLMGYVHVKSSPAANALYLLNISEGSNPREAFAKLRTATFSDRLLHSFNLGSISNGNASAGFDAVTDTLGNVQVMGFSAGNGFVIQQLGNERPYQASTLAPISMILDKAQARAKQPTLIDNAGNNRGAGFNGTHVFVASRQNGNHVYYWDVKDTTAAPKELSLTGVTGGTFVLSDLAVSGTNIFVSNMVLAGGVFKVYHWQGVESQPRVLLEFPAAPDRLGDAITVLGDPSTKALLVVSGHGSKRFYVWNIENGAIANTTPTVQTYDFVTNVSFGRMTRIPGAEAQYLASAPSFGLMLLDKDLKMVDTLSATFFPSWAMHAQVFEYAGQRLLGYVHIKSSPAGNALYVVDFNEKESVRDVFTSLRKAGFASRLLHTVDLGNISNGNASAGLDVYTDASGNVQVMAFSAGNGFVVQQFGNKTVTSLPTVQQGTFTMYPNPAVNEIQIESPEFIQDVQLFDVLGRRVGGWQVDAQQVSIPVSRFVRGTYVLVVRTDKGLSSRKLMLQH